MLSQQEIQDNHVDQFLGAGLFEIAEGLKAAPQLWLTPRLCSRLGDLCRKQCRRGPDGKEIRSGSARQYFAVHVLWHRHTEQMEKRWSKIDEMRVFNLRGSFQRRSTAD
jgi:hypothetical protein